MNLNAMPTDELLAAYRDGLAVLPRRQLLAMFHELSRRKQLSPEAYEIYEQLLSPKELLDPSGTKLTPSLHGRECLGNGEWPGYECCCDECDYYLVCFADWEEHMEQA